MNERIQEFAKHHLVRDEHTEFGWQECHKYEFDPDELEKFAELIVQEMLRLLEQYSRDSFPEDTIDDFDKGYLAGLHTAQKAVKEHFGVEE